MIKVALKGVVVVLLAIATASESEAQEGPNWASLGLHVGFFSPLSTYEHDMGGAPAESSFNSGIALGASANAWFAFDRRLGVRVELIRSETEGENSLSDLAPIAVNDPVQWLYTAEFIGRMPMGESLSPYVSLGAGMKQYNWKQAIHDEDRFLTLTGSVGAEVRPAALGRFGFTAELRGYQSEFKAFGINDGSWETGTPAREGTNIGFYGGVTEGLNNIDLLLSTGLSYTF
jgi:hypothetical protein